MEQVFFTGTRSDFQDLLSETINACLRRLPQFQQSAETLDQWLDIEQLCAYHPDKPARQTVYGWISAGTIPHHKSNKKLRFLKSEIDEWLLNGRKKTTSEIASEADQYLASKRIAK